MPDFIPRPLLDLLGWAKNASQKLNDDPERFGAPPELAQEFADRYADFAQSMQQATSPSTRTGPAIITNSDTRKIMIRVARQIIGIVRANPDFDPPKQVDLGLPVGPGRSGSRRKVGPPTSVASVRVTNVSGSLVSLKLWNPDHPSKRGLARDILAASIFAFVGENPPPDVTYWRHSMTSRANATIDLSAANAPFAKVWICARWLNRRGQPGPVGNAVQTHLGAPVLRTTGKIAA